MAKKRKARPAARRSAKTSKPASRSRRPAARRGTKKTAPRKAAKRVHHAKPRRGRATGRPKSPARPGRRGARASSSRPSWAPTPRDWPRAARGRQGRRRAGEAHGLPARLPLVGRHEARRRHRSLHARARRFLVHGEIHIEYPDGCVIEHRAPQIVAIDPGHDGWVVGKEPVVMIEFDFERDTVSRLGMPASHTHLRLWARPACPRRPGRSPTNAGASTGCW